MRLPEAIDTMTPDGRAALVYGQPYETSDGTTVITVARVRTKSRFRKRDDASADPAVVARPVGVYIIRDGKATWKPAVDVTRIALLGECAGLIAGMLATLAMVRRPPWPDVSSTSVRPATFVVDRRVVTQIKALNVT